ncbi:sigma 54-interacting transcriptional regulator [Mucilaginibacter sabulilitoris]|uniref:Sigma 54-interacting transcriptional regulator n=1 Tax=Mucilaginibacter sabulilitoris TaxID=1173583 RepID=A0ABZ0TCI2_9SPHI|nr:sigma 54-interacting transcriptional regulator [Mucilaginibacter sabulilitoris]WPU90930.1 sigma 54-interacting transcriptional regulator [Mucilaginibacter sabulilitoris]
METYRPTLKPVPHEYNGLNPNKEEPFVRRLHISSEMNLEVENESVKPVYNFPGMIGNCTEMQRVYSLMSIVAPSNSTVLLLGETGTGKEVVARSIHNLSTRKVKQMITINCGALPANLVESELFGHERGSFTGATERRLGKFEQANGGTLFLDEIGELGLDLQVKLLRALQEKEIERVGGKGTIKVNVRIIAATNKSLEKEMAEGRFRSDLYYRLNIFPISLPPLRERKNDIPLLTMHFVKRYSRECGRNINSVCSRVLQSLLNYPWPGNIRELEHLIERSVLLAESNMIKHVLLPLPTDAGCNHDEEIQSIHKTIDQNERDHIYKVLKYCDGRIAGFNGAAYILGVPATTLHSKMKRLGIRKDHSIA